MNINDVVLLVVIFGVASFSLLIIVISIAIFGYLMKLKSERIVFNPFGDVFKNSSIGRIPNALLNGNVFLVGLQGNASVKLGRIIGKGTLVDQRKKTPESERILHVVYFTPHHWIYDYFPLRFFRKELAVGFWNKQLNASMIGDIQLKGIDIKFVKYFYFVVDKDFNELKFQNLLIDQDFLQHADNLSGNISKITLKAITTNAPHQLQKDLKSAIFPNLPGSERQQ